MRLDWDIIVVGAGHAGCEAAAAAAKLGSRVLLVTMDVTKAGAMSCNPAVGGVAKGQIVREIDALGGQMGIITDRSTIQFRMLNRSKGAAVWSPRAQCDKERFSALWLRTLQTTPGLFMWQDSVVELVFEGEGAGDERDSGGACGEGNDRRVDARSVCRVTGVRTALGVEFSARAVILTAGTFLDGRIHVGQAQVEGGRAGEAASKGLTESLLRLGFEVGRMKTGTPARIDGRTIDFTRLVRQDGDEEPSRFSFSTETQPIARESQLPCYIAVTTPEVHDALREGFDRSPLLDGTIRGIGPRYCPSIEDKLRTFADKDSHQLFLEPEGVTTTEWYVNGFSSSLPFEVQAAALSKIEGLEGAHILKPGYAIEYDYFPPTQLHHTLATRQVPNLYFAGQVNGTTGYEEAAAQGLMAGINAHRALAEQEPFVLRRDEAYIGVLIDDLVTKGVDEPYRMFTSRAEYRILLRQDNADLRLTPRGREIGLVDEARWANFEQKKQRVESLRGFVRGLSIAGDDLRDYLISRRSTPLTQGRKLDFILARSEISLRDVVESQTEAGKALREFIAEWESADVARKKQDLEQELSKNKANVGFLKHWAEEIEQVEVEIKYRGYIEREKLIAEKLQRLEDIAIPAGVDFTSLASLTIEARQKLTRMRPATIGHAARIPGVSPADINVLLVHFGR